MLDLGSGSGTDSFVAAPDEQLAKAGRRLPQVLSRGEVERLLAVPAGGEPAALRDRALLELLYACGLRASEAVSLGVGDVDLDERVLRARDGGRPLERAFYGRCSVRPRGDHFDVLASGGEVLVSGVNAPPRPVELELLEAEELRLLAAAIGDHLPVELAERVDELRRRRRALELLWAAPA